jgi:hypothetical protein
MRERISVPAMITAIMAAVGSIGAMIAGVFAFGSWYGSLDASLREVSTRLAAIERLATNARDRAEVLASRQAIVDARLEAIERHVAQQTGRSR